ncbi:MAG: hypothetical protein GF311_01080 [Candidatus Lokiarchaeota archaeon]|nr:hypothetical protein [Candidatus Lokiarchaeota archaeon]
MEMDKSEILPAIGIIIIMTLMLGISLISSYINFALFCSGVILGISIFLCYRVYKEYKRSRNTKN